MAKLDSNLKGLQTKKKNRNNLLNNQKTRALGIRERSKLRSLEGTRFFSRKTQDKKDREKEAYKARLETLQQKQLDGTKLSKNNKAELYGTRIKKSLYKRTGMNKNATKKAQFNQLNKIKRKGDFTEKGDQKRYRQLEDGILKREGIKSNLNRKIMRKEQEVEALKAQSVMGPESSKRLTNLTEGVKRFPRLGLGTKKKSLNQLRKTQAKRNVNKIGREAVRDLERQRLLEQEQEQEQTEA